LSAREHRRRTLLASIMLVALALRALIPPGFMPASDRPFAIEICWEGFPGDLLARGEPARAHSMAGMDSMSREPAGTSGHGLLQRAHHQHSGSRSHSEHCVFGTASGAGPIPHLPLPCDVSPPRQLRTVAFVSIAGAVRLVHLPQPRAPPVG